MGALLRGRARAGAAADDVEPHAAVGEPPLRRHLGRRPGHHGSREPRRARGRRQDHRPQHPPAVRAGREPVHHRGPALRVPLLLHAEVLVRVPGEGAGHLSRRLRHLRRALRDSHARADRQAVEEDRSGPLRPRLLGPGAQPEADGRVGRDRRAGPRAPDATPTRRRTPSSCCATTWSLITSSRRPRRKPRRPASPRRGDRAVSAALRHRDSRRASS